jgi:PKD repeat protein
MHKLLAILAAFFIAHVSIAQSTGDTPLTKKQARTTRQLFRDKGELYFTFEIKDRAEVATLTKIISIDNIQQNKVLAFANRNEFQRFLALGYPYTVLPNPNTLIKLNTTDQPEALLNNWDSYPTYDAYVALMEGFATTYPTLCKLVNIGTLPSGRKLLVLKISDNINTRENEPQFLYTSSMHGDELAGYVGMLHYIDYLLSRYGTDSRVTYLVDNMEIWINPLANPDGAYRGGNNSVNGATRSNANNIDLNRNYPDPQDGPHPDGNAHQPETKAFMAFADTMSFVMAANFHGGAEVVNYPWDTWPTDAADANWWINESHEYADTAFAHSPAGYLTDISANGIINGYAWYEVNGGRQDYMNYFRHCRELTVELSSTKLLPEASLQDNWAYNYRSWLNYMEEALHGIRGIVTDACTGKAIIAEVRIDNHDMDNSHVLSGLPVGNYHRPIYKGTYNVTFSAPGYVSQTINGVSVSENTAATVVNVQLAPAVPQPDFKATTTYSCGGTVSFTDLTGSATAWLWSFGDGTQSTMQNPTHTWSASGTYNIALTATNCAGTNTVTKDNFVTVLIPQSPQSPPVTTCSGAAVNLLATAPGTIHWFNVPTGGTPLANTPNFTTPPLTSTTTYYVESDQGTGTSKVGALNNSIGNGGFFTANTYHYLSFNAAAPFQLLSVWVNANTTANRTIQLRKGDGTVLQSATINIPAGQSRVNLNFEVPIGEALQLGVAGGNNLFRNQTGAAYPYQIDGVVSIIGNSAGNPAIYYYFYDWEIRQPCLSPRVPVTVTIVPPQPPMVQQIGQALVASAAIGYQWFSVATGIIVGATASTFTPTVSGDFYVIVTDINGCTAASAPITFVTTGIGEALGQGQWGITIFPNPSRGAFTIASPVFEQEGIPIEVYNTFGQRVFATFSAGQSSVVVDSGNWAEGIFFVRVLGRNSLFFHYK